jgi:hypothetical protein
LTIGISAEEFDQFVRIHLVSSSPLRRYVACRYMGSDQPSVTTPLSHQHPTAFLGIVSFRLLRYAPQRRTGDANTLTGVHPAVPGKPQNRSLAMVARRAAKTFAALLCFGILADVAQAAFLPAPFTFTFFTPTLTNLFLLPFQFAGCIPQ